MYIYIYIHVYTFCLYITINEYIHTKATKWNVFQNLFIKRKSKDSSSCRCFCLSTQLGKNSSGTQVLLALTGKIAFHTSNFQPREMTKNPVNHGIFTISIAAWLCSINTIHNSRNTHDPRGDELYVGTQTNPIQQSPPFEVVLGRC